MNTENFEVYSANNTRLHCVCHTPEKEASAVLFIVHGLGEHSGRYDELAAACIDNQIAVYAFDHRGHGQSEGKRGHALSVDQLVEDMEHALMKCRSLFLEIPIFLYGHSMGGQVVASYLDKVKSKEISGAIISSAWFRLASPPKPFVVRIAHRLSSVLGSLTFSNGLDAGHISSVENEVQVYKSDPLIHDKISLSLFDSLFSNGQRLCAYAQQVKVPVLVCHGESDRITDPEGSAQYTKKLGEKAEFRRWKKAFHEPHHDYEKGAVIQGYIDWVKKQL